MRRAVQVDGCRRLLNCVFPPMRARWWYAGRKSMLPDKVFDQLLGSLSLTKPLELQNHAIYEAIPSSMATDGSMSFSEAEVRLWYRTDGNISFDRFKERLRSEERRVGKEGRS